MKIGVMLRDVGQKGGTGVYTRNLLANLLKIDHENRYHLLLIDSKDRDSYMGGDNVSQAVLPSRSKLWWDQVLVPRYAHQHQLDIVFNPKLSIPLRCSAQTVLVMHGAEQFAVPQAFKLADRIALMDSGEIVQLGSESDFRERPATPFVAEFLRNHLTGGGNGG